MDRRTFLKTLAAAGMAFAIKMKGGVNVFAQSTGDQTENSADLVAVIGGEPAAMFQKAIDEMGGIGKFVKRGQTIVVKPNIGWDRAPEMGATTNPLLLTEIIRQCLAAGAKEVIVFDNTCDEWRRSYASSGIEAAAKAAGARVLPANLESYFTPVSLPQGKRLKNAKIFSALLNCDAWINVPVLKHHSGGNMSISMKNLMGIVWDRRAFHRTDLQQCIADVCTLDKKPVLNVVDAYRSMKTNGPRGRTIDDVAVSKALFVSRDMVAVDTAATRFFASQIREIPLEYVKHISYGQELKVGTMDIENLNVKRIRM